MGQTKTIEHECNSCDEITEWLKLPEPIPRLFFDDELEGVDKHSLVKVAVCKECASIQKAELEDDEIDEKIELLVKVVDKVQNHSE